MKRSTKLFTVILSVIIAIGLTFSSVFAGNVGRDPMAYCKQTKAMVHAVKTADADGLTVAAAGYRVAVFKVSLGDSGDTLSGSLYSDLILQYTADTSSWNNYTDNNDISFGTVDASGIWATIDAPTEDQKEFVIAVRLRHKYLRVVYDITGTHTNGMAVSASCMLIDKITGLVPAASNPDDNAP